ncbi:Uncharacterised protein [Vibrio cholerae]|nr:Uncharacterised protein [Vibrio cholerae]CSI36813.1 Uncharacterised protein [Vibrio cholerae]
MPTRKIRSTFITYIGALSFHNQSSNLLSLIRRNTLRKSGTAATYR